MSRFNGKRAEFEASGEKINVAILGAGRIAHTMAGTLTQMAEDSLYSSWIHPYAVAARDITRAQAFADQWHFDKAYGSYEELVADPDVDLVYIATPHSLHAEQAILCMKAGKNVLVVGPRSELGVREVRAGDVNLISVAELDKPMRVTAKTHYRQRAQAAEAVMEGDQLVVRFDEAVARPAAGQSLVLYDGDAVVGGGTIEVSE